MRVQGIVGRGSGASGLGEWLSRDLEDGRGWSGAMGRVMSLFGDVAVSRDCDAFKERAVKAVGGRGLEFGWQTRKENLWHNGPGPWCFHARFLPAQSFTPGR